MFFRSHQSGSGIWQLKLSKVLFYLFFLVQTVLNTISASTDLRLESFQMPDIILYLFQNQLMCVLGKSQKHPMFNHASVESRGTWRLCWPQSGFPIGQCFPKSIIHFGGPSQNLHNQVRQNMKLYIINYCRLKKFKWVDMKNLKYLK